MKEKQDCLCLINQEKSGDNGILLKWHYNNILVFVLGSLNLAF